MKDLDRRRRIGIVVLVALLALVLLLPSFFLTSGYRLEIARLALYMAILAATWSLLAGIAGQFSFAHVAIAGLGAYASAIWVNEMTGFWGGIPGGIVFGTLVAGVVGTLLGLLLLRLRAAYLALFTIAFAELIRLIAVAEVDLTGGRLSLNVQQMPGDERAHFYLMVAMLLLILGLIYALLGSRVGLFMVAMRENEEAASALGVNVVRYKIFVFSITSLMLGLSATTYVHTLTRIAPERLELLVMGQVIAVAVIGGLESPLAAAIGAVLAFGLLESLRELSLSPFAMDILTVLVGLVVITLLTKVFRAAMKAEEPVPPQIRSTWGLLAGGVVLVGAFLFMIGSAEGAGAVVAWTVLVLGVVAISLFVMRAYATGMPAWLEGVFPSLVVGAVGLALLARLIPAESLEVNLGVWRFGIFGAILMFTLRFARNGLVFPILEYFSGARERRKETVAFRDAGDVNESDASAEVGSEVSR